LDTWTINFSEERAYAQFWRVRVSFVGVQNPNAENAADLFVTPADCQHVFRGNGSTTLDFSYQVMQYKVSATQTLYGRRLYFEQYSPGTIVTGDTFNSSTGLNIVVRLSRLDDVMVMENVPVYSWTQLLVATVSSVGGLFTGINIARNGFFGVGRKMAQVIGRTSFPTMKFGYQAIQ